MATVEVNTWFRPAYEEDDQRSVSACATVPGMGLAAWITVQVGDDEATAWLTPGELDELIRGLTAIRAEEIV